MATGVPAGARRQRERRRTQGRHPQNGQIIMDIEADDVGRQSRPDPVDLDRRIGLAGHDMGVGDHQAGAATQPLPSTPRPQAVPNTRTTLRLAASTAGLARIRRVGADTSAAGPRTRGQRIDPGQRVQDRSRRRQNAG